MGFYLTGLDFILLSHSHRISLLAGIVCVKHPKEFWQFTPRKQEIGKNALPTFRRNGHNF